MRIKLTILLLSVLFLVGASFAHEKHGNSNANNVANADASVKADRSADPGEPASAPAKAREPVSEFPSFHPLIVHFPIVLILLAGVFQMISLAALRREMGWIVLGLTAAGAITAWLSSNTFHPHTAGLSENAQRLLLEHELYADLTFWFAIAAIVVKSISIFVKRPWWTEVPATLLLLVAAVAVAITGHHGAELVHKEGVGPQGQFLEAEHDH